MRTQIRRSIVIKNSGARSPQRHREHRDISVFSVSQWLNADVILAPMFEKNPAHQSFLESLIAKVGGVAGTVHEQRGDDLYLTAAHHIPPPVVAIVAHVPHGKGMAGIAQVKKQPVQTCNLQTDDSGTIKPGAKAVDAQAAIAVPVLDGDGEVRAVVGVAWAHERELSVEFEHSMMQMASLLPDK